jgi:signal transduction histidine kinase
MSAALESTQHSEFGGRSRRVEVTAFQWSVAVSCIGILITGIILQWRGIASHLLELAPWIILLFIANLLPISAKHFADLTADWPIHVAAALVLPPVEAALVAFLGAFDPRELRRQIGLGKALFNRGAAGLMVFAASSVVQSAAPSPSSSPLILLLSLAALGTALAVNYALTATAISLEYRYPLQEAFLGLRMGSWPDFALTLVSWSVLGAMLALLYDQLHPAALFAFLAPTLLGRQTLKRSQMFIDTKQAYRSSQEALRQLSQQIYDERLDERKLIAADLHDEVLQPLFKVTLTAQVLRTELSSGRLLEIEEDLPQLVTAAELASSALRDLIGNLRRSSLGVGGLPHALLRLTKTLSSGTSVTAHTRVDDISGNANQEVALYQIAKEALSNALTHSKCSNVWVELTDEGSGLRLIIRDDGRGFDVTTQKDRHYGILIMRERAAAVGGEVYVDSSPGSGTIVTAVLPKETG